MEKHDDLVDILTEFEEETGQQEYEQGVRLIKSNKPEEAIDLLRESVKKWGFNADRWAWLSFACVKLSFQGKFKLTLSIIFLKHWLAPSGQKDYIRPNLRAPKVKIIFLQTLCML